MIPDRLIWMLFRRWILSLPPSNNRFASGTYVDKSSVLGGRNYLAKGSKIIDSTIGRYTYSAGAIINNADVGAFCSVAGEVLIGGLGKHPTKWLSTHPAFYSKSAPTGLPFFEADFNEKVRTTVGNDVWIGRRAIIIDGAVIGDGVIVAAGAVVAGNVEPYSVVGGVPARLIRKRFSADVIEKLTDSKWWLLPASSLTELSPHFSSREQWSSDDLFFLSAFMNDAKK